MRKMQWTIWIILLVRIQASFVPYHGWRCSEDQLHSAHCFSDFIEADFSMSACWERCILYAETNGSKPIVAAYACSEVLRCCCATSCPCLVPELNSNAQLAIESKSIQPAECLITLDDEEEEEGQSNMRLIPEVESKANNNLASMGYDIYEKWSCQMSVDGSHRVFSESPFQPSIVDITTRSHLCWQFCLEHTNGTSAAAVVNTTSCTCLTFCDCLQDQSRIGRFDGWASALARAVQTPGDCDLRRGGLTSDVPLFDPYVGVDCPVENVNTSIFIFLRGADRISPRQICWQNCHDLLGAAVVAAAVEATVAECRCYTTCDCLEVRPNSNILLAVDKDPPYIGNCISGEGAHAAPNDKNAITNLTYSDAYWSASGYGCSQADSLLCHYDLTFAPVSSAAFHTYQCWAFCYYWGTPNFQKRLGVSYGDSSRGECCCAVECGCLDENAESTSLLALAVPNEYTASPVLDLPPMCPAKSEKKNARLAPGLKRSDFWWIILICVIAFVFIGFFIRVEQIDSGRRSVTESIRSDEQNHEYIQELRRHHPQPIRNSAENLELIHGGINSGTSLGT